MAASVFVEGLVGALVETGMLLDTQVRLLRQQMTNRRHLHLDTGRMAPRLRPLCSGEDLRSRRVVGRAMGETNGRHLTIEALRPALRSRPIEPGLVHQMDLGSTYASPDYRRALEAGGVVASMSRKGDCWNNAARESFFASLKRELVDHKNYATRADAAASIADYIDNFYNPVRRHSTVGCVSPIEYELNLQCGKYAA